MFEPITDIVRPPRLETADGEERRVGVEVEFAGLSARDTANCIAQYLGGTVRTIDQHRFQVDGGSLGTFRAELDSRYAHPEGLLAGLDGEAPEWLIRLSEIVSEALGHAGAIVIPCEVVAAPVPVRQLTAIDQLIEHLKRAGAQGTHRSIFYAFGVHLNVEIATSDAQWLTAILKSQALLSPWLRNIMEIDTSRYLTGFASPFPPAYLDLLCTTDYDPGLEQLIDDYIASNPTRDRELDMLPLFAWLQPDKISRALPHEKINARPTLHYRLPNAALERSDWSVVLEWNRWCHVERLAHSPEMLTSLISLYRQSPVPLESQQWVRRSSEWLAHHYHQGLARDDQTQRI